MAGVQLLRYDAGALRTGQHVGHTDRDGFDRLQQQCIRRSAAGRGQGLRICDDVAFANANTDTDSDTDSNANANSNSNTNSNSNSNTNSNTNTNTNTNTNSNSNSNARAHVVKVC
jgi:hypothetical protein